MAALYQNGKYKGEEVIGMCQCGSSRTRLLTNRRFNFLIREEC